MFLWYIFKVTRFFSIIYLFIYQAVQCFHISLRPFNNYIIFSLQLFLSFQSSSINPFSLISPLIPSAQVSLGLPRFLLPGGRHFITSFGSLPSPILWTCPYHWSCLVLISSKRDLVTFIFCLIILFLIFSFLENRAERRQKSIPWNLVLPRFFLLNTVFWSNQVLAFSPNLQGIRSKSCLVRTYQIRLIWSSAFCFAIHTAGTAGKFPLIVPQIMALNRNKG